MKRDALKSASTAIGQQPITLDVLKEKYLKDGETSEQDIYRRVARALASVEPEADRARWEQRFFDNLQAGAIGAEAVTRAYVLQRWVQACAGRGHFPIKFNGSLFTVDRNYDADYRRWGGGYWWQNTRLIYWTMLANGDYDLMRPLFRMYREILPLADSLVAMGCEVVALDWKLRSLDPVHELGVVHRINAVLRRVRPSVVFSFTFKANFAVSLACLPLGIPNLMELPATGTRVILTTLSGLSVEALGGLR